MTGLSRARERTDLVHTKAQIPTLSYSVQLSLILFTFPGKQEVASTVDNGGRIWATKASKAFISVTRQLIRWGK